MHVSMRLAPYSGDVDTIDSSIDDGASRRTAPLVIQNNH